MPKFSVAVPPVLDCAALSMWPIRVEAVIGGSANVVQPFVALRDGEAVEPIVATINSCAHRQIRSRLRASGPKPTRFRLE